MDKKTMLECLINHYTDGNKAAFARMLTITPQVLSQWLARSSFDNELLFQKCPGVSASWLLTGEGEMFEAPSTPTISQTVTASSHVPQTAGAPAETPAAINALLAAKMSDCESRGIAMELTVESPWKDVCVPSWEVCRVLGNLIDNAMDALSQTQKPVIRVTLGENLHEYSLSVANNGPMIPEGLRESIFQSGFSTKSAGRGMGLAIVR